MSERGATGGLRLVTSPGARTLPPLWDGRRVEWDELTEQTPTTLELFHMTKAQRAQDVCTTCGTPGRESLHTVGVVHPLPGDTMESSAPRKSKRTGRTIHVPITVSARPLRRLHLTRCQTCGLDVVWDSQTDEWWDLDDSDYGPEGSTDPRLF